MSWLNNQVDDEARPRYGVIGREMPESAGHLVLPVLLGVVVALVVHFLLYAIVLVTTLARFDYAKDFTTGDAVQVSIFGALGLGIACLLGSWICGRRSRLRDVPAAWVRRAALGTGITFGVLMVVLGLALAERPVTLPIYAVGVIGGSVLGAWLATRTRAAR